ncbi:hypothetical protein CY34DRAFT_15045 [Suillus luteus UH-Slu-Lm8-n1]|uniref:Uncharacterized protein n=1 Tax=Suillus luteus UH-Slu-Lm8-n1 TaxID=930992 RepID=A0A0C9ZLS4_9AGAM|nr:hypothetical protein CY34DRAFT_15045 [Suillus luteus UH-Slu-Lm8-n1]
MHYSTHGYARILTVCISLFISLRQELCAFFIPTIILFLDHTNDNAAIRLLKLPSFNPILQRLDQPWRQFNLADPPPALPTEKYQPWRQVNLADPPPALPTEKYRPRSHKPPKSTRLTRLSKRASPDVERIKHIRTATLGKHSGNGFLHIPDPEVLEMMEEQKRMTSSAKGKERELTLSLSDENHMPLLFCQRILATATAIDRSLRETKGDAFVDRLHAALPKISSELFDHSSITLATTDEARK